MIVIQKNVVDAVLNEEGVFVQKEPDYVSYEFTDTKAKNAPPFATGGIIYGPTNMGGVKETHYTDAFSYLLGLSTK
jgi:hypothetical protein